MTPGLHKMMIGLRWMRVLFIAISFNIHLSLAQRELGLGAYLPDYRVGYNVNASAPHLTDLILFSIQPNSRGMIRGCCLQNQHFQLGRDVRKHNANINVWVAIGGSGRSDDIPLITGDETKRKILIDGAINLCKAHELHGVDLDIFRPQTSEEYHNFLQFVQEASIAWHAEGIQLSVTCHPHRFKLPRSVFAMVDRVNLMAYDMVTGQMMYHSTLSNTQEAVDSLLTQNCPANKIWLGIPSYGRSLLNPHDAMTFESLHKTIQGKSDYNVDTTYQHDGYEWDSPERIRAKIDYADFQQLGGVFFWELGQDYQDEILAPGGILLEAASSRRRHLLVSKSKDEL